MKETAYFHNCLANPLRRQHTGPRHTISEWPVFLPGLKRIVLCWTAEVVRSIWGHVTGKSQVFKSQHHKQWDQVPQGPLRNGQMHAPILFSLGHSSRNRLCKWVLLTAVVFESTYTLHGFRSAVCAYEVTAHLRNRKEEVRQSTGLKNPSEHWRCIQKFLTFTWRTR